MTEAVKIIPLSGIPLVQPGDRLVDLLAPAVTAVAAADGDILVVAQKIVSKAEDRYVNLSDIVPTARAEALAQTCGKDARLVELILRQSGQVIRCAKDVIIVRHKLGFVHANAGIDHSNIRQGADGEQVLLLPEQPDRSAAELRAGLAEQLGLRLAVIINDSAGRAWRLGISGFAIGAAGITCLLDKTGQRDLLGNELFKTEIALADEIAAAASLLMGQTDEGIPAVLIKGLPVASDSDQTAADLIRAEQDDLFL
ncbi:MAG: coenzyme F420-0:L-glutamate ligase [Gammaproteobacteria bacterium]